MRYNPWFAIGSIIGALFAIRSVFTGRIPMKNMDAIMIDSEPTFFWIVISIKITISIVFGLLFLFHKENNDKPKRLLSDLLSNKPNKQINQDK
jgi:hypothetical protein